MNYRQLCFNIKLIQNRWWCRKKLQYVTSVNLQGRGYYQSIGKNVNLLSHTKLYILLYSDINISISPGI